VQDDDGADVFPNEVTMPMRTLLAGIIGLVVGGAFSSMIVSIKGPVFHWEMAGMIMIIISAVVGGISGGLSSAVCARTQAARTLKSFVGLCVGAGLGLAVGLWVVADSSARAPGAPEGLTLWTIVVVVIAGSAAGLVGGLVAKSSSTE
jgi:hypothetical protein